MDDAECPVCGREMVLISYERAVSMLGSRPSTDWRRDFARLGVMFNLHPDHPIAVLACELCHVVSFRDLVA